MTKKPRPQRPIGIVLPLAVFCIGVYGTYSGLTAVGRESRILNGAAADARVVQISTAKDDAVILLEYTVNGKPYQISTTMPKQQYYSRPPNAKFVVKYVPADPTVADLDSDRRLSLAWKWLGAGLFELVVGVGFVYAALRRRTSLIQATHSPKQ